MTRADFILSFCQQHLSLLGENGAQMRRVFVNFQHRFQAARLPRLVNERLRKLRWGVCSVVLSNPPPTTPPKGTSTPRPLSCLSRLCHIHWLLLVLVTFEWMWHAAIPEWTMQATEHKRNRGGRETEGLTVPLVYSFNFGQTHCCFSQLLLHLLSLQQSDDSLFLPSLFVFVVAFLPLSWLCSLSGYHCFLFISWLPPHCYSVSLYSHLFPFP